MGVGVKEVLKGNIVPAREVKNFPGLWFMWGRLQMIRDWAPGMATRIKKRLGHPVPADYSLFNKVVQHVVVGGAAAAFISKYYNWW